MLSSNLQVNVYLSAKFKGDSIKDDRENADINNRNCWLCIFFQCPLVTLTFDLCTQKCIQLFYKLLYINWPNMRKIRWKMAEISQNADSGKEIKETRIEPVGKPYRGCIELLFCLTVTMTFGVQTWKFIGLMDKIRPIYQPSFTEIRSKIREK